MRKTSKTFGYESFSHFFPLFLKLQMTVLSLLILTDIMIMTSLIDKLTYT